MRSTLRPTQRRGFPSYDTRPDFCFGRTSLVLQPLAAIAYGAEMAQERYVEIRPEATG